MRDMRWLESFSVGLPEKLPLRCLTLVELFLIERLWISFFVEIADDNGSYLVFDHYVDQFDGVFVFNMDGEFNE